jgi:hypothetical protein
MMVQAKERPEPKPAEDELAAAEARLACDDEPAPEPKAAYDEPVAAEEEPAKCKDPELEDDWGFGFKSKKDKKKKKKKKAAIWGEPESPVMLDRPVDEVVPPEIAMDGSRRKRTDV